MSEEQPKAARDWSGAERDLVGLVGLGLLGAGLWWWWPPAALMVVGVLLLLAALVGTVLAAPEPRGPRERPQRTPRMRTE